jgi:hypothetical protein
MEDSLTARVPSLEEKEEHLDNKVLDLLIDLWAKKLGLERTIKTNEDYKSQNARQTKKLESRYSSLVSPKSYILIHY